MAFPIGSKPPAPPVQQSSVAQQPAAASVNQNNGNFEKALEGDLKGGGRGGLGGEFTDTFSDEDKSGGVILNPDDLLA